MSGLGLRPTWFVVEGPDGAGKSSLAKKLAHALSKGPCVLHRLDYDSKPTEYSLLPATWRAGGMHVVQDRGALSGPVYEPLFRGDMARMKWLDPLIESTAAMDAKLIFMTASLPELERRVSERGDDYITPDRLKDIVKGYDGTLQRWVDAGGDHIWLDTTDEFPSQLAVELAASALATS